MITYSSRSEEPEQQAGREAKANEAVCTLHRRRKPVLRKSENLGIIGD